MERVITILIFGIILIVPCTALLLLTKAIFPKLSENSQSAISNSIWRSFLVGVVNSLFLGAILLLSIFLVQRVKLPALFFLPGILAVGSFIIGTVVGLGSVSVMVGERMLGDHNPIQQQVRAGILIFLAFLTPFVGWYIFFPFVFLTGFGGFVTAFFQAMRERKVSKELESD